MRRFAIAAAIVGAGLLLGACRPSSEPSGDVGSGAVADPTFSLIALDDFFHDRTLNAKAGEEIIVQIRNEGDSPHEFAIPALDLSTGTIDPGDVAHARFEMPRDGVEFECRYHDGMRGRIET